MTQAHRPLDVRPAFSVVFFARILFIALCIAPLAYAQHGGSSGGGSSGGGSSSGGGGSSFGGGGGGGSHSGGGGSGFSRSGFSGSHSGGSSGGYGGSHGGATGHGAGSGAGSRGGAHIGTSVASGTARGTSVNHAGSARDTVARAHGHSFWHALVFWHHSAPTAPPAASAVISAVPPSQIVSHIVKNHDWSGLLPTRIAEPQPRIARQGLALPSKLEPRRVFLRPDQVQQDRHRRPICGYRHELCHYFFYPSYDSFLFPEFDCDHSLESSLPVNALPEPYPGAPYHIDYFPCQRPVLLYDIPPSKNVISAKTGLTVEPALPDFNLVRIGW